MFERQHLKIFRCVVLSLLLCLLISCTQVSNQQYLLLFVEQSQDEKGTNKVYAIRPDGTELKLLTEFSSIDYWLSPDGNYLAVFTLWGDDKLDFPARTLVIINVLTGEVIDQISDVGYLFEDHRSMYVSQESVVWSPQSDQLLFERNSLTGVGSDIWHYDLNSGVVQPLIQDGLLNQRPSWSPDGSQIAYISTHPCHREGLEDFYCLPKDIYWDVKVLDVINQVQRTITDFSEQSYLPPEGQITPLCHLRWSPNKLYVAFENQCGPYSITEDHKLFIASVNDLQLHQIHQVGREIVVDNEIYAYKYGYEWSSVDKLYVGYTKGIYLSSNSLTGGILVFDPETGISSYLVKDGDLRGATASWSRDQKQVIVFTEQIEDYSRVSGSILFGNLEEDNSLIVEAKSEFIPGSCDVTEVYWSPDGQYVSYAAGAPSGLCNDELSERGIAVISLDNGQMLDVVDSLSSGDYRPIGWVKDRNG